MRWIFNPCIINSNVPILLFIGECEKIVIIAIAVIVFGAIFFLSRIPGDSAPKPLSREEILARQRAELDRLREEALANPLTEEEIKKQTAELDKLRKQSQANPLSQEELNRQMEELNKLRLQSN